MTRAGRLLLPDLLRGAAIVCMLIAHAVYLVRIPPWLAVLTDRINNVASPLFAVAMGMAAAIMLQRSTSRREALLHNVIRSVIIIALGWWMSYWGSWIAIVLCPLGITLLIGSFLLLLPVRAQAVLGVLIAVLADPVNRWVLQQAPLSVLETNGPGDWLLWAIFTGPHYRATNLLPMFLLGAVLFATGWVAAPGRRSCVGLLVGGVALNAVGSKWLAAVGHPVSGSIPDTVADLGLVLFALGLAGLMAARPDARPAVEPVALLGTVALSAYLLQVAVVAAMAHVLGDQAARPDTVSHATAAAMVTIIVAGVPLVCLWWAARFRYGPVEWLIGWGTGRYR